MRHVFIGGLHRSGTTVIHDCIAEHPDVDAFTAKDVQQNEGQFLQDVYPNVNLLGGAGVFGFSSGAHRTEEHATAEAAAMLRSQWEPHWAGGPIRAEKTPQNIVMSRFLQAVFPGALFVFVVRHPLAVAMATSKWSHTSVASLVEHWVRCHHLLVHDLPEIHNYVLFRYEDFVTDPDLCLGRIYGQLGVGQHRRTEEVRSDANRSYEARWARAGELAKVRERAQVKGVVTLPVRYRAEQKLLRLLERNVVRRAMRGDATVSLLHRERPAVEAMYTSALESWGYSIDHLAPEPWTPSFPLESVS